jgi:flagellar export protein FliJ
MKRFKFRFEQVLRHRETLERLQLQKFAEVQARMVECERAMQQIAQAYDENLGVANVPLGSLVAREHYLDSLITRMERTEELKVTIGFELDEVRQGLVAAQQAREVLEQLKEKHRQEHRVLFEAAELAQLDEVAVQRAARLRRAANDTPSMSRQPKQVENRYEFAAA